MGTRLVDGRACACGVIVFGVMTTAAGVGFLFMHQYSGGALILVVGLLNVARGSFRRRVQQRQTDAVVRVIGAGSDSAMFDRLHGGF